MSFERSSSSLFGGQLLDQSYTICNISIAAQHISYFAPFYAKKIKKHHQKCLALALSVSQMILSDQSRQNMMLQKKAQLIFQLCRKSTKSSSVFFQQNNKTAKFRRKNHTPLKAALTIDGLLSKIYFPQYFFDKQKQNKKETIKSVLDFYERLFSSAISQEYFNRDPLIRETNLKFLLKVRAQLKFRIQTYKQSIYQ